MKRVISFLLALSLFVVLTSCTDSNSGNSVIDEPEVNPAIIDLSDPSAWSLASTPADPLLFPEAILKNNVDYGKNRALLAWYTIDPLFTQRNSSYAPAYIKNDLDGLSYPYAREVAIYEVFPGHDGESSVLQTFNLSFYPRERGPYNLDSKMVDQDGTLLYPERRWGGIMRSFDIAKTNFEQAGIKYIQFWLLDPFMDDELDNRDGGFLYFNLGEVSEDVLNDGRMSHESGSPLKGDNADAILTIWGKVHAQDDLLAYANDDTDAARRRLQDVGLDGLINEEEFTHPTYANYLDELRTVLSADTYDAMLADPFSPFNDPAGDNYAYYLHSNYDNQRVHIIGRYKHYNGTDGNSLLQDALTDAQYQQAHSRPDNEDIDYDNALNENERFFQYRIAIHPDSMQVGRNYITDKREAKVHVRNGMTQVATWYQFTIPLADYQKKVGSIQDFSYIRFMRIFMTGFKGITHLRFATLELTPGE